MPQVKYDLTQGNVLCWLQEAPVKVPTPMASLLIKTIDWWLQKHQSYIPPSFTFSEYSATKHQLLHLIVTAFEHQTKIGWAHFLRGRLSKAWQDVIAEYYKEQQPGESFNPQLWTRKTIDQLWDFYISLWHCRNGELHRHDFEEQKWFLCGKSNFPPISLTTHLIFHIRYVSCVEYNACVCLEERITGIGQKFVEKSLFSVTTLCACTLLLPNAWWLLSLNLVPLFFLSLFDLNIKDVRNDALFVSWDWILHSFCWIVGGVFCCYSSGVPTLQKTKTTINLWAPLFFLSWFDLNIKGCKEWFIVHVMGLNTSCVLLDCWQSILLSSFWRADTAMTKTTINLWAPLFFLSLFDLNIKDVRNDALFVSWDWILHSFCWIVGGVFCCHPFGMLTLQKTKTTINLWVPLFFLSWFDLNIKGGKEWFIVHVMGSNTSCVLLDCWQSILLSSFWHANTAVTKTTINLWVPLFFLSLFDLNIKDVRNDASFVSWYWILHSFCWIVGRVFCCYSSGMLTLRKTKTTINL